MEIGGRIRTFGATLAFAFLLAVAATIVLFGLMSVPMCMCAAPPAGWHRVTSLKPLIGVVGPSLGVFLVGEYLALGSAGRQRRLVNTGAVLVLTAITAAICIAAFVPCCGEYAP